jgi:hypothetical protein
VLACAEVTASAEAARAKAIENFFIYISLSLKNNAYALLLFYNSE